MILHFLKLFARGFRRNLAINLLNLLGLSAGLAACMMIIIFLHHEYSFDTQYPASGRIARVNTDLKVGEGQEIHLPTASYPVSAGLADEIGDIENFARFRFSPSERPVYVGDRIFFEGHMAWADSTVFDVFGYRLVVGDRRTALAAPQSVVISESTARKFFGDANPMGMRLSFDGKKEYAVTGVMEDIPQPSHLPSFPMLMSMSSVTVDGAEYWVGRSNFGSYVLLSEGRAAADVQPAVDKVFEEKAGEVMKLLGAESRVWLQPIREIHFDDSFDFAFDFAPAITHRKVTIFALLAAFILAISIVSFINLATARSGERARQVGICKAVGASRGSLAAQFLGEFVMISLAALAVAFLLVRIFLPVFADFTGRELQAGYLARPLLPLSFLALAVLSGILAGLYPAFFLSSFRPVDTIRSVNASGQRRSRLRPALIVFQFTISIILAVCTLTVMHQLRFMEGRDAGFDMEHLMVINVAPGMTRADCEMIRQESLKHPGVLKGTLSTYLPTLGHMEYTYDVPPPADCEMLMTRQLMVDDNFIDVMGMELLSGRNFAAAAEGAGERGVIINETAARKLGFSEPVGRLLDADPAKGEENYDPVPIIGVVRDINFESLHRGVEPMVLALGTGTPGRISLRLRPGGAGEAIKHVEEIWKKSFPQAPFKYSFLDESFERMYQAEIRLGRLFSFYTALAIVISCVGLLALISYSNEKRTREVGIRKVLGASEGRLFMLLSREYLILVILANLAAWPVSAWAMSSWMNNFAYKAPFAWWFYPVAGGLALLLAVATSASLTLRVCAVNPAETLRHQ